jgi:hypothetical protein
MKVPVHIDQNILKDKIIQFPSYKVLEVGILTHKLRFVHVYKENENKVIAIITNQLEYNTVAERYKKQWDIELFF